MHSFMLFSVAVLVCYRFLFLTSCVLSPVSSIVFVSFVLSTESFLTHILEFWRCSVFARSLVWGPPWPAPTSSWTRLMCAVWLRPLAFLAQSVPTVLPPDRCLVRDSPIPHLSCRFLPSPGWLVSMRMWLANVTKQRGCDSDCSSPLESHWHRNTKKIKL